MSCSGSPQPRLDFPQETLKFRKYVRSNGNLGSFALVSGALPDGQRRYLSEQAQNEYLGDIDRLSQIVRSLRSPENHSQQINHHDILMSYKSVYATLLYIGRASRIDHFMTHDTLADKRGPWSKVPEQFPDDGDETFWKEFLDAQWKFFVPDMENYSPRVWLEDQILPFHRVQQLGAGNSGIIFKIEVNPAYNYLHEKNQSTTPSPGQRRPGEGKGTNRENNIFCLKTFRPDCGEEWQNGGKALAILRTEVNVADGVIGYYGSYTHGKSFSILLEFANGGTLEDYLRTRRPPSTTTDISNFWTSMCRLTGVLAALVNLRFYEEMYTLWHFDIRPEKILVIFKESGSIYKCDFKLVDFGSNIFRINEIDSQTYGKASPGTRTYSAPELYCRDILGKKGAKTLPTPLVGPQVDSWSLGCIFSEVATWVIHDYQRLENFRTLRCDENWKTNKEFTYQGCFHNGDDVLECVKRNHAYLRETVRRSDETTPAILEIVEKYMLVPSDIERKFGGQLLWAASNLFEEQNSKKEMGPGVNTHKKSKNLYAQFDNEHETSSSQTIAKPSLIVGENGLGTKKQVPEDTVTGTRTQALLPLGDNKDGLGAQPILSIEITEDYQGGKQKQEESAYAPPIHAKRGTPKNMTFPQAARHESVDRYSEERSEMEFSADQYVQHSRHDGGKTRHFSIPTLPGSTRVFGLPSTQSDSQIQNMPQTKSHRKHVEGEGRNGVNNGFSRASYAQGPDTMSSLSTDPVHIGRISHTSQPAQLTYQYPQVSNSGSETTRYPGGPMPTVLEQQDSYPTGVIERIPQAHIRSIPPPPSRRGSYHSQDVRRHIEGRPPSLTSLQSRRGSYHNQVAEGSSQSRLSSKISLSSLQGSYHSLGVEGSPHSRPSNISSPLSRPGSYHSRANERYPQGHLSSTVEAQSQHEPQLFPPVPILSRYDLLNWQVYHSKSKVPYSTLLEVLNGRNFVLLFDDSYSMVKHWSKVVHLAAPLTYVLKRYCKDGIKLCFTNSEHSSKIFRTTELRQELDLVSRGTSTWSRDRVTDFCAALSKITVEYRNELQTARLRKNSISARKSEPKKTILFVFTDGIWQPDVDNRVRNSIRDMVRIITDYEYPEDQFGIQFIQFGNDYYGSKLLDELDDFVEEDGRPLKPDIVDTEPDEECNMLKILLGSCNKWFDSQPTKRTLPLQHLDSTAPMIV